MFIGLELTVKNGKRAFLCIVIFFWLVLLMVTMFLCEAFWRKKFLNG